jgi:predicted lipoprotein
MAGQAQADPPAATLSLVDGVIIPRFKAVEAATRTQEAAWTAFCADRRRAAVAPLKDAYAQVGDAWARIEFARIGPADANGRALRFDYWLDRQNATGKAMSEMLASDDPGRRTQESIAAGSVAGQGLPLLERLLYEPGA